MANSDVNMEDCKSDDYEREDTKGRVSELEASNSADHERKDSAVRVSEASKSDHYERNDHEREDYESVDDEGGRENKGVDCEMEDSDGRDSERVDYAIENSDDRMKRKTTLSPPRYQPIKKVKKEDYKAEDQEREDSAVRISASEASENEHEREDQETEDKKTENQKTEDHKTENQKTENQKTENRKTVNQETRIDWKHPVILDILPKVCQYLMRIDTRCVGFTCRAWFNMAMHVFRTRYYIQKLRLTYKFENLNDTLFVEPKVSLLIYDSKLENSLSLKTLNEKDEYRLKKKLLKHMIKKRPKMVVVLSVKEYLTTEDLVASELVRNMRNHILGLFIPSWNDRLRVRIAWHKGIRIVDVASAAADELATELLLHKSEFSQGALLIFIEPNEPGAAMAAFYLAQKVKDTKEAVFISEVGDPLASADCNKKCRKMEQCIVAMRIVGLFLESWSDYIDLRLPREEIEQKLKELKERVRLKRYCTALISAPCLSPYGTSQAIMQNMNRIFPNIPFVGLFDKHHKTMRAGVYSTGMEDCLGMHPKFDVEDYAHMSIIIITYE